MTFGMGMVKGREEEWGEPGDVQSKVGIGSPTAISFRVADRLWRG